MQDDPHGPPPDPTQAGRGGVWHDVGTAGPAAPVVAAGGGISTKAVVAAVAAVVLVGGAVTTGVVLGSADQDPVAQSGMVAPVTVPAASTAATATGTPFTPGPVSATADCQAAAAVDAGGTTNSYEPARAFDGLASTAWRCEGDASGLGITFDFGAPVVLTSVGLVPGYDKVDPVNGADRFLNSRRIQQARWVFDDGSSVAVTPAGERTMTTQAITPTTTTTARLVVGSTVPGATVASSSGQAVGPTDYTSVSEVAFRGLR